MQNVYMGVSTDWGPFWAVDRARKNVYFQMEKGIVPERRNCILGWQALWFLRMPYRFRA